MKTIGIDLITQERNEQIIKHGRSQENDVLTNSHYQLATAAVILADPFRLPTMDDVPDGWDLKIWAKMIDKTYEERVIIAGALLAAEIDRLTTVKYLANKANGTGNSTQG
jgi:hypothetical protein